jgi:hypothetical protein
LNGAQKNGSEKLIAEWLTIMLEYFAASFESQWNIPTEWG